MEIAILIFDDLTTLDAVGPYEVIKRLPGANVRFVAQTKGLKADETGAIKLEADHSFEDVTSADILLVPGGFGTRPLIKDDATLKWVRAMDETTTWTTSVCTGSLVLAAAGLLNGRSATTHWLAFDLLKKLGAHPTEQRVVVDGKYVTAAGVSSGIDMGLQLVQLIEGDELAAEIQLAIEYDPQPPLDSGSPRNADPALVRRMRDRTG